MFASRLTRRPRTVPSRFAAIEMSCSWSRPWWADRMLSERVSVYLTGLPTRFAAMNVSISSPVTCSLPPNPPPTSGAMTRTFCSGVPVSSAIRNRRMCGICVDDQIVTWSPDGSTMTLRGSMNAGISRCCLYRRLMTTSALANASAVSPPVPAAAESKTQV